MRRPCTTISRRTKRGAFFRSGDVTDQQVYIVISTVGVSFQRAGSTTGILKEPGIHSEPGRARGDPGPRPRVTSSSKIIGNFGASPERSGSGRIGQRHNDQPGPLYETGQEN